MKTAIEKIVYGETQCQNFQLPKKFNDYSAESIKVYEKLIETLDDSQKEQLEKFLELEGESSTVLENLYYQEGFKLGLQIGVETFKE